MKAKALLAAAATVGSTILSVVIGAPTAHAQQACNWTVNLTGKQPSNSTMDGPYNSYNLYNGNSTSCGKTGATVVEGMSIKVYCHEDNNQGTSWVYIEIYPGVRGWTSRANVGSWWPSVVNCA